MKVVDLYARVRRACHVDGMSQRRAARLFGIDPKTVAKMLRFSVPPGYRRSKPVLRPKLDPLVPVIERILEEDEGRPRKQRHTARRIFERLRAEHGYTGGETIVKDYVRDPRRQRLVRSLKRPAGGRACPRPAHMGRHARARPQGAPPSRWDRAEAATGSGPQGWTAARC